MINEKLLNILQYEMGSPMNSEPIVLALRRVIRWHSPTIGIDETLPYCNKCGETYACTTIQLIARELIHV